MVFKLADALSRPFHRHFSPSEHSDAKQDHSTRQHKTLELPQLRPRPFGTFHSTKTPSEKYLELQHLDNVKIFAPGPRIRLSQGLLFATSKDTPQETQAQASSRQPRQNSTVSRIVSPPRILFATFNRSFLPPRTCSLCKQRWFFTQPQLPRPTIIAPCIRRTLRASHKLLAAPEHPR